MVVKLYGTPYLCVYYKQINYTIIVALIMVRAGCGAICRVSKNN